MVGYNYYIVESGSTEKGASKERVIDAYKTWAKFSNKKKVLASDIEELEKTLPSDKKYWTSSQLTAGSGMTSNRAYLSKGRVLAIKGKPYIIAFVGSIIKWVK